MRKFVVYSVLTGGYDNIIQPLVVDDRFDYILYTDNVTSLSKGVWSVRKIPYEHWDKTRQSRYPKMHPNMLLAEYCASLYIDANIQIVDKTIYDRFIELYYRGVDWSSFKHSYRDCIYDEAYVAYGLDTEENILRWCHRLRKESYPRHYGLYENGLIYRIHNEKTLSINNQWWELYDHYTRRDQLTLCYVLWKDSEINIEYFLGGESIWNTTTLHIYKHHINSNNIGGRIVRKSFLEHFRNRCRIGIEEKIICFKEFHYWLYKHPLFISKMLLYIWGWYALIVYGLTIKYRTVKKHKNET